MAKVKGAPLAPDALPRFRGNIIAYNNQYGTIIAKWPKKRGPPRDWKTAYLSNQFGNAGRMAANALPLEYETAKFLSQGTVWLPRDILVMAAYGKLYNVLDPVNGPWSQSDHSAPPGPAEPTWHDAVVQTLNKNTGTLTAFTMRQRVQQGKIIRADGTASRFTFQASTATSGLTIIKAYAQLAAISGDNWDFETTPVQITFDGQPGTVIPISGSKTSDEVPLAIPYGRSLVVSYYCAANSRLRYQDAVQGFDNWYKLGDDAATVNATGYTFNTRNAGLQKVEILAI